MPTPLPDPRAALRRHVDAALDHRSSLTDALLPHLLTLGRGAVVAVVHYGSFLHGMAADDSEPDFYLVVNRLRDFHPSLAQALLNQFLPPSIYHPAFVVEDRLRRCKVCVIAAAQLADATSPVAADLYHLGRFSKRIGLLWARDAASRALVVDACASSLEVMTQLVLGQLEAAFTLDEYLVALLGLSYLGERRIAEPSKARTLLEADRAHLEAAGRLALSIETARRGAIVGDGDRFHHRRAPDAAARLERIVRRSRRRALWRWPKHLVTFDGWLDYLLAKLQRQSGVQLELSERQRRHPLLLAWPHLLGLQRRGLVR